MARTFLFHRRSLTIAVSIPVSPARRALLMHTAAASLSLILPACKRDESAPHASTVQSPFEPGALRLDLRQRVTMHGEDFALERLRLEPHWPASLNHLTGGADSGDYRLSAYDAADDTLLFRQGFDSALAADARAATTQLSIRLPMPSRALKAVIEKRRANNLFVAVSTFTPDPAHNDIDRTPPAISTRVHTIQTNGAPASKVDLAILGDGYRESEYDKFIEDAKRAAGYLFAVEPFKRRRNDFNVSAVFAASADSGVTDPYLGLKKDTAFGSAYYAGGSERALADNNNHALREAASAVPYDFLLVLANARRYGGSAYYGGPAVAAIDSAAANYLVVHEFAHVIGGLADEYYLPEAGGPAYNGNIEPWYPNVTISPASGKWRGPVTAAGAALPAPSAWNKAAYERYFADYVKRYDALRAAGAAESVVEQFLAQESARQAALLAQNEGKPNVGYYEGANGFAMGMYRAEADCIMFSLQTRRFCAACAAAIEQTIDAFCR